VLRLPTLCRLLLAGLCLGCGKETKIDHGPVRPQAAIAFPIGRGPFIPVADDSDSPRPPDEFVAATSDSSPTDLWTRARGEDWPVFLGPTGDSKSSETGIVTDWREKSLRLVWQKDLGTSYGAPAISRGRLFQFDRFGNFARLYALNAETGEELWRYEYKTAYEDLYGYNNGPRCSPIVDEERVYAFGVDGVLVCVRAADGKPIWKVDTNQEFGVVQNFFGVGSTPVIEGDLLIVMVGGSPPESQSVPPGQLDRVVGNGSGIVAFDKLTGEVKYKITDELASYASLKLATIAGRRWCFAFCREGLVGFEPASGKVDFHYPWRATILESVNASMPVVVDDEVFISETYGPGSSLLQVAPGKYDLIWSDEDQPRDKAMQLHWMTPVYVDGYLYGSSGRHSYNAELRCIEWKTGKVMWSVPEMTRSSLLLIDGHFLVLGEYGQLSLVKVNPEKFELVTQIDLASPPGGKLDEDADQRRKLDYPCWAAPIVSHGLLYLRGDKRLICLELIPDKPR
jgi:outer membrane protein assembly factor BamB